MTTTIEVVYEHGLLRPLQPLTLAEGAKVEITLRAPDTDKLAAMREAMNDPLFLADLREVAEDFRLGNLVQQPFQVVGASVSSK